MPASVYSRVARKGKFSTLSLRSAVENGSFSQTATPVANIFERSERVENFLFRPMRELTEAGIEQATVVMRCHGANSPEPRRRAVPGSNTSALCEADTSALCAADQQLFNRTSLTSWAHRGSLSKRRELVLSSLPTPTPLFFADYWPPVSKVACLISLYLLFTCMYHTFSHITFLGYNHMHSRASAFPDSLRTHIIR